MTSRRTGLLTIAFTALASALFAQSQAIDASLEGVVRDGSGAALPGTSVTLTNVGTGTQRTLLTLGDGSYRALALPLGVHRQTRRPILACGRSTAIAARTPGSFIIR